MHKWILAIILATNFSLNVWGIEWGLPERWHPDEVLDKAEVMYALREINHNYYTYGALPFYQVELVAVAPVKFGQALWGWHDFEARSISTLLARLLSAVMGTGIVAGIYGIGKNLFDKKTGLIAAALTGLTMGLVNLSHFATVDISSLFWFTWSSWMAVKAWQTGSSKAYVGAGVCSGLAAAVRFVGGISIIVVIAAHWLRKKEERKLDRLMLAIGSAVIALMVANAPMVALPCYFAIGYVKDFFFNSWRNASGQAAWGMLTGDYINATGWPLALLSLGGIVYALWLIVRKKWWRQILLIAAMTLPYYFIVGRMNVSHLRYALPLAPFLLILAGKMLSDFMFELKDWQRIFWRFAFSASLVYSLVYVAVADLNFIHDSRGVINEWLMNNVSGQETIEVTSYVSDTVHWFFDVTRRPHDNGEWATRAALENNSLYLGLLSRLTKFETMAERAGVCAMDLPVYETWNEQAVRRFQAETAYFDMSPIGLKQRQPDVLVVSEFYYDRFLSAPEEVEGTLFDQLFKGKLPYSLSEEIWFEGWTGFRPRVEFVNPKLKIYKAINSKS